MTKRPIFLAYAFLLIANLLDLITSVVGMSRGMLEANPFARDLFYHLLTGRLITLKLLYICLYVLCSLGLYLIFSPISKKGSVCLAALVPLWTTYGMLEVTIHNITVLTGWFQP